MFKLLTTATIAALSAVGFSATALAQVDEHGCPEGTTWTETAGVPVCLAPIWLDGTWNDDPHDCVHGWYQGSCAPPPQSPADLPVDAYLFQMDDPSPEYVAEVVTRVRKLDRFRLALSTLLG